MAVRSDAFLMLVLVLCLVFTTSKVGNAIGDAALALGFKLTDLNHVTPLELEQASR